MMLLLNSTASLRPGQNPYLTSQTKLRFRRFKGRPAVKLITLGEARRIAGDVALRHRCYRSRLGVLPLLRERKLLRWYRFLTTAARLAARRARGGRATFPSLNPSPGGAILRHMKVEEIAEVVAKLPPDQLARFAAGSPHSRRAAPTTPRSSTPRDQTWSPRRPRVC